MHFDSPIFAAALLPVVLSIIWLTRRPVRAMARWCMRAAVILFWLSLAGATIRHPRSPTIVVLIDVSPSTRGALLREPGAVAQRLAPLLAGRLANIEYFADGLQIGRAEPAIDRTRLDVPPCDSAILFSDGRFDAPSSLPPMFPVIDPSLDSPGDGSIASINLGKDASVSVAIGGLPRTLKIDGAAPAAISDMIGQRRVPLRAVENKIAASLDAGDRWPENDSLSIQIAAADAEQWAIDMAVPGMKTVPAARLSTSAGPYLTACVIVLPAAADISDATATAVREYVESLGGTLIVQGSPALAPAALRSIAPLTATPPQPQSERIILLDSSGSMAAAGRWPAALAAAERALSTFAANDVVTLGTFNRSLHIVVDHQSPTAALAALHDLGRASPGGPTGLKSTLENFATAGRSPRQIFLLTDGDADLGDVSALARKLKAVDVSLYALLAGPSAAITQLAEQTGGAASTAASASDWSHDFARLAGSAATSDMAITQTPIAGSGDLAGMQFHPSRQLKSWPRDSATTVAKSSDWPLIATWQVGLGRVISVAADLPAAELAAIATRTQEPAADPRFSCDFDEISERVSVKAINADRPMNGLHLICQHGDRAKPLIQIAPGVYEAPLSTGANPSIAVIINDGRLIARRELAGRYVHEFDAIGNDRAALAAIAVQTGGRVIDVGDNRPIDIPTPYERRSLRTPAAVGGFALSLAALLLLRMPYLEDRVLALIRSFRFKPSWHAEESDARSRTAH